MDRYDNRLASFTRGKDWPFRKKPKFTEKIAKSGFHYTPFPLFPSACTCYLCGTTFKSWTGKEDPYQVHADASAGNEGKDACPLAVTLLCANKRSGNPADDTETEMRLGTFAGGWPYDGKAGFEGLSSKRMASAGFICHPLQESEDNAHCPYCELSLDGWEAGDDPRAEHQKRTPDCPFFVGYSKKKKTKSRKAEKDEDNEKGGANDEKTNAPQKRKLGVEDEDKGTGPDEGKAKGTSKRKFGVEVQTGASIDVTSSVSSMTRSVTSADASFTEEQQRPGGRPRREKAGKICYAENTVDLDGKPIQPKRKVRKEKPKAAAHGEHHLQNEGGVNAAHVINILETESNVLNTKPTSGSASQDGMGVSAPKIEATMEALKSTDSAPASPAGTSGIETVTETGPEMRRTSGSAFPDLAGVSAPTTEGTMEALKSTDSAPASPRGTSGTGTLTEPGPEPKRTSGSGFQTGMGVSALQSETTMETRTSTDSELAGSVASPRAPSNCLLPIQGGTPLTAATSRAEGEGSDSVALSFEEGRQDEVAADDLMACALESVGSLEERSLESANVLSPAPKSRSHLTEDVDDKLVPTPTRGGRGHESRVVSLPSGGNESGRKSSPTTLFPKPQQMAEDSGVRGGAAIDGDRVRVSSGNGIESAPGDLMAGGHELDVDVVMQDENGEMREDCGDAGEFNGGKVEEDGVEQEGNMDVGDPSSRAVEDVEMNEANACDKAEEDDEDYVESSVSSDFSIAYTEELDDTEDWRAEEDWEAEDSCTAQELFHNVSSHSWRDADRTKTDGDMFWGYYEDRYVADQPVGSTSGSDETSQSPPSIVAQPKPGEIYPLKYMMPSFPGPETAHPAVIRPSRPMTEEEGNMSVYEYLEHLQNVYMDAVRKEVMRECELKYQKLKEYVESRDEPEEEEVDEEEEDEEEDDEEEDDEEEAEAEYDDDEEEDGREEEEDEQEDEGDEE
ncbi:hypothetical protein HK104_010761 [Borealophlyctis nickersoniae]|nr:hypothetical protein HK104_010761 [Borealophlyctis nickersoniae]